MTTDPSTFRPHSPHIRPNRNDAARSTLANVPAEIRRIAGLLLQGQPLSASESVAWNAFQLAAHA